jgi:hypothetical protein
MAWFDGNVYAISFFNTRNIVQDDTKNCFLSPAFDGVSRTDHVRVATSGSARDHEEIEYWRMRIDRSYIIQLSDNA